MPVCLSTWPWCEMCALILTSFWILGAGGVLQLSIDDLKQTCGNFHPSKQIGKGGFGEVFRVYFRSINIAIKLLSEYVCILYNT